MQAIESSRGEQITLLDVDLDTLRVGEQLQLGPTACVEITQARNPCSRLAAVQQLAVAGLHAIWLMARVIVGGTIRVGDAVVARSVSNYRPHSRQDQVLAATGSS